MDLLYIPQLDEMDTSGEGGANTRYRLLKRTPENGIVLLTDRAVTRVELATNAPVKFVFTVCDDVELIKSEGMDIE